jgi:NAD(P)-dependent dehydrogenase (short-subunit alcohol dehydrogenase family)
MNLDGKVCLITGGTKDIGAAAAVELARHGADLSINGRNADEDATRVKGKVEALGRKCLLRIADVGKAAEAVRFVEATADALGSVDVLVHSAGGAIPGSLLEVTVEDWHRAFDIHVHAIFHLCRAAIPRMKAKRSGAIVLISSAAGLRGCLRCAR